MTRHKRTKKNYIQLISQYGIHIWAILIIANAAMVYAYQFSTHAASKTNETLHTLDISSIPSPSVEVSPSEAPTQAPFLGPGIILQFSVPGIGSGGGVMKPAHLKRNLTVYLYSPDVNSLNPLVKPLYTIQTSAAYDSNQYSPTYTSFLSPGIDLGSDVKDGDYQIAFRTDQSLKTVLKQNSSDLGGEIFSLTRGAQLLQLPPQTVLMGDVIPINNGDNTININDYNAFVSCYGNANTTNSFCKTGNYGDFNDDGIIDGIDYNILLRSLSVLAQEGLAVPHLSPTPSAPNRVTKLIHPVTPTLPTKKTGPTPTPSKATASAKGGSALGGILFFLFLIILGVIGFLLFKNENLRSKVMSLIHLSPTGTPSTENAESADTATEQTESTVQTDETPSDTAAPPGTLAPSETAAQPEVSQAAEQPAVSASAAAPVQPKTGDALEKDCYVKIKGKDETGTGMWLLLTDDNGAVNAHYAKSDAKDGFAKVKGVMKEENGKKFLEISELTTEG